jgi:hypothetical protein
MKLFRNIVLLMLALALGVLLGTAGKEVNIFERKAHATMARREKPAIDRNVPRRIETATFALG